MRWDLAVPGVVAVLAGISCARIAGVTGDRWQRAAWYCQAVGCVLWALAALSWLSGASGAAPALADLGRAGFLGWTAAALWPPGPGYRNGWPHPGGVAKRVVAGLVVGGAALTAGRFGFATGAAVLGGLAGIRWLRGTGPGGRAVALWFAGGLSAIAAADLDALRGAGSAGLGWLLGFGCLAMGAVSAHAGRHRPGGPAVARALRTRQEVNDLAGLLAVTEEAVYQAKIGARPGRAEKPKA